LTGCERIRELANCGDADRSLIVAVVLDEARGDGHCLGNLSDVLALRIEVLSEGGRNEPDDDQHDQSDALLPVIRAVREAERLIRLRQPSASD
jgi:hypothetical protein